MELTKDIVIICPHCQISVLIEQLNCNYFIANNMIYGCGKPFQIEQKPDTNEFVAIICEYI
jgi:hypothetical protein